MGLASILNREVVEEMPPQYAYHHPTALVA
jgi:hypothetical protein